MSDTRAVEVRAVETFNRLIDLVPDPSARAHLLAESIDLPGVVDIGPELAKRLVDVGPITDVSALLEVAGIGPVRLKRLVAGLADLDLAALAPAVPGPIVPVPTVPPTAASGPDLRALPGLDVLGRGVYLRPHAPYELKRLLFEHRQLRAMVSKETGERYGLPEGFGVNESPPLPGGVALNQSAIESSWERFAQRRRLDASAAAGSGPFSISATASTGSELRSDEQSYYATRSSFLALWDVWLEDPTRPSAALDSSVVPTPYDPRHRDVYERFFQRFGSHFVKRVWVGGRAELVFTVARASGLSASDIQAGLSASQIGGSFSASSEQSRAKLLSSSRCTVLGRGGDEGQLASLSSLDEAAYNAWIATIRDNPQSIELEVAGIWTLIDNPAAATALRDAYTAATCYQPISAIFRVDDVVVFVRGRSYFAYDLDTRETSPNRKLTERWPMLVALQFEVVDAALSGRRMRGAPGEHLSRKLYLFRHDQTIRIDLDTDQLDPGYPKRVCEEFPGVSFAKIDAVMSTGDQHIYFFAGSQYIRFDLTLGRAEEGYPDDVAERWRGVNFDRIDATLYRGGGKVYFFREDQHIRYDVVTMRADPGYPKAIVGNYVEDWRFFE